MSGLCKRVLHLRRWMQKKSIFKGRMCSSSTPSSLLGKMRCQVCPQHLCSLLHVHHTSNVCSNKVNEVECNIGIIAAVKYFAYQIPLILPPCHCPHKVLLHDLTIPIACACYASLQCFYINPLHSCCQGLCCIPAPLHRTCTRDLHRTLVQSCNLGCFPKLLHSCSNVLQAIRHRTGDTTGCVTPEALNIEDINNEHNHASCQVVHHIKEKRTCALWYHGSFRRKSLQVYKHEGSAEASPKQTSVAVATACCNIPVHSPKEHEEHEAPIDDGPLWSVHKRHVVRPVAA
mmetsp:Transcript_10585/g.23611  ORF Transcript_10585/g.23611 Transcript_10585/m.23611 type:complete len:288 (-) Transcript_10585:275-1138(-)